MDQEAPFIEVSELSLSELLKRAEASFSAMSYEKAKAFYQEAYIKAPESEDLLCSYANFLVTIGEIPLARSILRQALELNITKSFNYKKFVQMAELVDGKLSVQLYEKAIEILKKLYNPIIDSDPLQNEIKRDLALAHSALAELYQTDLLQYKESELLCKENIEEAIRIDSKCLDAYLQKANFYLNKEDVSQAKYWLKLLCGEVLQEDPLILEEEKGDLGVNLREKAIDFYPLSFKIDITKVLIEVEEYLLAIEVLEDFLEEDMDNNEGLYLLAFCLYKAGKYNKSNETVEELEKKDLTNDEELLIAFKELKEELKKVLEEEIEGEEEKEALEQGEEEDWMDFE